MDWTNVAFSDSKYWVFQFSNSYSGRKAWVGKDEQPVRYKPKNEEKVHAYAAITYYG